MNQFVRASLILLSCVAWSGGPRQASAEACDSVQSVTVSPEEYVGDARLRDLMAHLIASGRKMAVEQVTTTRVLAKSTETIQNDNVNFQSYSSERFVGTVNSHEILAQESGRIGKRETLRLTMRVNVCVGPANQIWYIRVQDIESERSGVLDWMTSRLKSPTDRIQLVRSGELGADDASYTIRGLVFSERISVGDFTNEKEIQEYNNCVRRVQSQTQTQKNLLNSIGLGRLGSLVPRNGNSSAACGNRPQRILGKRLETEAIFQIKICDPHLGDCQAVRQLYDSRAVVKTKKEEEIAVRRFYHEGFGLVGSIALHNLQRSLGMLDK